MQKSTVAVALAASFVAGTMTAPTAVTAAVNYFDTTRVVTGAGRTTCPTGYRLTGGGVEALPPASFSSILSTEYTLRGSHPYGTNGWSAEATRTSGRWSSSGGWRYTSSPYSPRVYAICVR